MNDSYGLGWLRDAPDIRDYAFDDTKRASAPTPHAQATTWLKARTAKALKAMPAKEDLSQWCSPIENQANLGSCTANAGVGLIEYYERRAFGVHLDASRLFLYKVTRNLMGVTGDTGAFLRTTMKTMAIFGVLPEKQYAYDIAKFDLEPSAFSYSFAQAYQSLAYFRLDQSGMTAQQVLDRVKQFIAAGFPSMFGFTVYNFGNANGEFEFPSPGDAVQGGHAIVAIGYDDARKIGSSKGALKIRNSWGTGWGQAGYGWLPYDYVLRGLAVDFWSLFRQEYIATTKFD